MELNRTITTQMLETVFKYLIKKLNDDNVTEILIDQDLYRFIPTDDWQKFDEDVILTGSLFDDYNCLKLVTEESDRPFTYVDFDRTASLLRSISEKLNPVNG